MMASPSSSIDWTEHPTGLLYYRSAECNYLEHFWSGIPCRAPTIWNYMWAQQKAENHLWCDYTSTLLLQYGIPIYVCACGWVVSSSVFSFPAISWFVILVWAMVQLGKKLGTSSFLEGKSKCIRRVLFVPLCIVHMLYATSFVLLAHADKHNKSIFL